MSQELNPYVEQDEAHACVRAQIWSEH